VFVLEGLAGEPHRANPFPPQHSVAQSIGIDGTARAVRGNPVELNGEADAGSSTPCLAMNRRNRSSSGDLVRCSFPSVAAIINFRARLPGFDPTTALRAVRSNTFMYSASVTARRNAWGVEDVGEVQERSSDRGHRNATPLRDLLRRQPPAPMHPDPVAPYSSRARRHCHIDEARAPLPNAPKHGGAPMRKNHPRPARQHRRQPVPLRPQPIVPHGIDPLMQSNEPLRPEPFLDAARAEADRRELATADNAPLPPRQTLQLGWVDFAPISGIKRPTPKVRPRR